MNPMDSIMGISDTPQASSNPMDSIMGISQAPSDTTVPPTNDNHIGTPYIAQKAQELGLDPQAVLGVAQNEGLGGGVGDNGTSFGPFQLHEGGALPPEIGQQGPQAAQAWAWSREGIDYALGKMAASGAAGLKGMSAVDAIVRNFERPKDPTADLQSGYNAVGSN